MCEPCARKHGKNVKRNVNIYNYKDGYRRRLKRGSMVSTRGERRGGCVRLNPKLSGGILRTHVP